MAQFGKVSVNPNCEWFKWTWKEFIAFYDTSLRGQVTETPEEVAKVLGVKVPVQKPKADA